MTDFRSSRPRRSAPALLLAASLSLLSAPPASAQAGPCAPDNRAVHDFQVGDVFQYSESGAYRLEARVEYTTLRKYRIVSVEETAQARTYRIRGLHRSVRTPQGREASIYVVPIDDTLTVADSTDHPLNGCPGDVVPIPNGAGYKTRVTTAVGDTRLFGLAGPSLRLKWMDGEVRDPKGPVVDLPLYDLVYAEGLGLVRASMSSLGSDSYRRVLIGYVKGGDTVGVVYPDAEHTKPLPVGIAAGGPGSGAAGRSPAARGARPSAFDLLGRPARARLPAVLRF